MHVFGRYEKYARLWYLWTVTFEHRHINVKNWKNFTSQNPYKFHIKYIIYIKSIYYITLFTYYITLFIYNSYLLMSIIK